MDNHLGTTSQFSGRIVIQIRSFGKAACDLLLFIELSKILRRRNNRDFNVLAARGLAHGEHLDAVGCSGEGMKVSDSVAVIGEVEIISRIVAEHGNRGGHLRKRERGRNRKYTCGNTREIKPQAQLG